MTAAAVLKNSILSVCAVLLVCVLAAAADTTTPISKTLLSKSKNSATISNSHTAKSSTSRKRRKSRRAASWRRGQQKVDPARAREIQEALIRQHYFKGTASGQWDDATQSAMRRYQAANGWQTKTVPDARALIKLGLGPSHDHLLNPESAMTGVPQPRTSGAASPDSAHTPAPQ